MILETRSRRPMQTLASRSVAGLVPRMARRSCASV
jgi:hypothetical protein